MPLYEIEAHGFAVEYYGVEADSEEEAREKFERGDTELPWYTEVSGVWISKIRLSE